MCLFQNYLYGVLFNFHILMMILLDDDAQSTIANCVKSRQRIKRRFTDDIVDTDLGILSMAAMASVKKVLAKQENKGR